MATDEAPSRDAPRLVRWPLPLSAFWLLVPFLVLSVAMLARPTPPHDYWWHLVQGRLIHTSGELPRENLFLYTLPTDAPFINQPWLGQLGMYLALQVAGHVGPALLLSLCVGAAWLTVVFAALNRVPSVRAVALVSAVGALFATPALIARTQMFAFVLFAALLRLCFDVFEGRLRRRALVMALPLTAVWANVHGSFVLAPLLVGAFSAASLWSVARRHAERGAFWAWLGLCAAVAAACLASPLLFDNIRYLVEYSKVQNVSEWQAPDPTRAAGALTWLAVIGSCLALLARRAELGPHHVASALLLSALALSSRRAVVWWALALPLMMSPLLSRWPRRHETPSAAQGAIHLALVAAALAAIVAMQPGVAAGALRTRLDLGAARRGPGAGVLSADSPILLVQSLHGEKRRVFHEQRIGALLEYELTRGDAPDRVAFVDQRMELIPEQVWDEYFEISAGREHRKAFARWNVHAALVHVHAQAGLLRALETDPEFVETGREGDYVLFRRQ